MLKNIRLALACVAFVAAWLGAPLPAQAGLRTRQLPDLAEREIEPAAQARAARSERVHIHVVVEGSSGSSRELESLGIRLLRSIDGDLWLASVPVELIVNGTVPGAIRKIWDLRPQDRISPLLAERLARRTATLEPVRLRIKVFAGESLETVRQAVRLAGGTIVAEAARFGILDVEGRAQLVSEMSELDPVRWIESAPERYETANDDLRVDAEINSVQSLGIDGTGVIIGMWDSGLPDTLHPDLAGRVTTVEAALPTALHSTHVAGIAMGTGANSANQGGTALQWRGVATGASMVNYSVPGAIAEIGSAIASFDIDLSTNSWVYPVEEAGLNNCDLYGDYASDAPEFDQIVRGIYGKPIAVAFAAGNERDDGDCELEITTAYGSLPPPGTAKNVITVGAHYSDLKHMTPFSSWGPTDDGRMKPDMTAPGCQQFLDFGITSTSFNGTYAMNCGTSMATPAVSGACAMLIQEWRTLFAADPSPATLKALLGGFAKDRANPGPDYRFGLGAINVARSISELQTATTAEGSIDLGGLNEHAFHFPPGSDTLTITLVWDDPVGAELADTTLVNDLDLKLLDPLFGVHLPFVLDPAEPELDAATGVNRLDNVEQVRVIAPVPGYWRALVSGPGVVQGPQVYSLVGIDARPPAAPAFFSASVVDDTTSAVTWIRPDDVDRAGTILVRSTSPITWAPGDGVFYAVGEEPEAGVFVVAADDSDRVANAFSEPVPLGSVFHYSAFSHDEIPNYASGVFDMIETEAPCTTYMCSGSDQIFAVGDPSTVSSPITIIDTRESEAIKRSRDIRIEIPDTFPMVWDTSIRRVTVTGPAADKVSAELKNYEDGGKTAVVDVTTDFLLGDQVTISDLKFMNFTATSDADRLLFHSKDGGAPEGIDTKTITIIDPAVDAPVVPGTSRRIAFRSDGPNPFRSRTAFRFDLSEEVPVSLVIFDTAGRRVTTLTRGSWKAGSHRVEWAARGSDGQRVAAGIYFARFRAAGLSATEKIILLR